jgi:GntR family transcriptional regulator, transcriptional repressor for pyruvate dehydrogenase complex
MNKHSDLEERTVNDRSKPPKAAVLVAQQVVDEIIDRRLEPGEMLAQERDMIAQYGVGRATLREALRLVELEGALSIRPGPGGGPMVARPTPRHLASTFALVLQLTDDDFGSIIDCRRLIEPVAAAQAARRASPEQIELMRQATYRLADGAGTDRRRAEDVADSIDFHDLVGWASGNTLLALVVSAVNHLYQRSAVLIDFPPVRTRRVAKHHEEILEAIESGDSDAAAASMAAHLEAHNRFLKKEYPQLLHTKVRWELARY